MEPSYHYQQDYQQGASLLESLPKQWLLWMTQGKLSWFVTVLLGVLLPFSFAPFNHQSSFFAYLLFIPLSLFFYQLLHCQQVKDAIYRGALFAMALFSVGVSWLYVAIHDFGAAHWTLAAFFTVLFIVFLSSFYALFAGLIVLLINQKKLRIVSSTTIILVYIPLFWVFFEWLRSWLLTGFPWLLVGYPMIETPLASYAPIFGIYGLSLLVTLLSSLLIVRINRRYSLMFIVIIFIGSWGLEYIQWSKAQGEPLSVALIQGNVNQAVKWQPWQLEKTKQIYVALSQAHWQDKELIVWPENAIPVFYHQLESNFYHDLLTQAKKTDTELIIGLPYFDDQTEKYYNAMMNLGGQQRIYYKTHLVPFGEYVPLASLIRGLIRFFNIPMSGFSAGNIDQPPLLIKGYQVAVTLCYEDVFPQDMMTHIADSQLMINLSNNGWYGDSLAPHQHLEMARMRALESSRELIRSTTSGISALIDSKGHIKVQGPQFKRAVVEGDIQPRMGTTPYVFWKNYPIMVLFVIAFLYIGYRVYPIKLTNNSII
jgi:apolipoprotein N-acyltransferase